jgi:hypothetical protein
VPLAVCSFTKDRSSVCSAWESGMSLLGSAAGAPGLSSITWSQGQDGGNLCKASSKNTLEFIQYCAEIFGLSEVFFGSATTLQM